jgi:MOSC domain-containing protein YiiM
VLRLGEEAQVRLTGVRTPCRLIDSLQPGLMKQMWAVDEAGQRVRKAGVMAVVVTGGAVRAGDPLTVVLPAAPHVALGPV